MIFFIFVVCWVYVCVKIVPSLYTMCALWTAVYKIPGPVNIPVLGSIYLFFASKPEDYTKYFESLSFQYKDGLFKTWYALIPVINVRSPKHVEVILSSTVNIEKSPHYDVLHPWLGQESAFLSGGASWRNARKLIGTSFHANALKGFAVIMFQKADYLVYRIDEELKKDIGKPLNVTPLISEIIFDIIYDSTMGAHASADAKCDYKESLEKMLDMIFTRLINPFIWDIYYRFTSSGKRYKTVIRILHEISEKAVRNEGSVTTSSTVENVTTDASLKDPKRETLLHYWLHRAPTSLRSMDAVKAQLNTVIFAGYETLAAACNWCLFCLGNHLDYQERIHKELEEVFGDSDRTPTWEDLSKLECLSRAMKESLRLFPSAPHIARRLIQDIKLGDYRVPKGCIVVVSPYLTHRDADVWPNPNLFDPDRFSPENSKNRNPYTYIPFSAGPRNCIGRGMAQLEEKILLVAILRKWRIKSVKSFPEMKWIANLTMQPLGGIQLHLIPKESSDSK